MEKLIDALSAEKLVEFVIRCALLESDDKSFVAWAENWINGDDRSSPPDNLGSHGYNSVVAAAIGAAKGYLDIRLSNSIGDRDFGEFIDEMRSMARWARISLLSRATYPISKIKNIVRAMSLDCAETNLSATFGPGNDDNQDQNAINLRLMEMLAQEACARIDAEERLRILDNDVGVSNIEKRFRNLCIVAYAIFKGRSEFDPLAMAMLDAARGFPMENPFILIGSGEC